MTLLNDIHQAHKARRKRLWSKPKPQPEPVVEARPHQQPAFEVRDNLIDMALARLVREAERRDGGRTKAPAPTVKKIVRAASEFYNLSPHLVMSRQQRKNIVLARQVAMYIAGEISGKSCAEVARRFDRDHSTIIHAVDKIERLMARDERLRDEIQLIKMKLLEGPAE